MFIAYIYCDSINKLSVWTLNDGVMSFIKRLRLSHENVIVKKNSSQNSFPHTIGLDLVARKKSEILLFQLNKMRMILILSVKSLKWCVQNTAGEKKWMHKWNKLIHPMPSHDNRTFCHSHLWSLIQTVNAMKKRRAEHNYKSGNC